MKLRCTSPAKDRNPATKLNLRPQRASQVSLRADRPDRTNGCVSERVRGEALHSSSRLDQTDPLRTDFSLSVSEKKSEHKTDREVTYIKAKLKHQIGAAREEKVPHLARWKRVFVGERGKERKIKTKGLRGVREIK